MTSSLTKDQIRDLLRENGVSPTNKPEIYNFYVEGRNVADENYSSERVERKFPFQ